MKHLLLNLLFLGCIATPLKHPLIISTSACYMGCPHFTLNLQSNYSFALVDHSKKITHKGRLTGQETQQLQLLLKSLAAEELKPTYGNQRARDLQKIHLQYNQQKIAINGKRFAPKPVKDLLAWAEAMLKERPK